MKSATFASLLAAFVSATSAQNTPATFPTPPPGWERTNPTMAGNAIHKPGLNEIVPCGIPYNITWTPSETTKTVSLYLLRGPSTNVKYFADISKGINNVGWVIWTPPTSLEPDTTGYGIRIDVDGTQDYQYSTQFGISNDKKTTPAVKPTTGNKPPTPNNKPVSYSNPTVDKLPVSYGNNPTTVDKLPTPEFKPMSYSNIPTGQYKPVTNNKLPSSEYKPVVAPPANYPTPSNGDKKPTVIYSTHYSTVTDCSCPTDAPCPSGSPSMPGYSPAYPSGVPGGYHNTTGNNTQTPPPLYTGAATHAKAGGVLIALAAGFVVLFL